LPVVREDALPRIGFQDRVARLLELENESTSLAVHQQRHPADCANAPDTHDLDCGVLDLVAIEQHPAGRRERLSITLPVLPDVRMDISGDVTLRVKDRRQVVLDDRRPARSLRELRKGA